MYKIKIVKIFCGTISDLCKLKMEKLMCFLEKKKGGKCKNVAVIDDIPCDVLIG